jgi:hypothetical protein
MPEYREIAVLVLVRTSDQRLFPENLDVSTVPKTAALRSAVIASLPKLTRVVMVTEPGLAELMCAAHDEALKAAGLDLVRRPPRGYVPP